jgi:ATP-dependent DNA helicase PIF1
MSNLTTCQTTALELLNGSDNVFLTGVAGSGKSYLLQEYLKGKDTKTHPIVASTGAAAVLVNGVTFHSFFSLGIMEGGLDKTIERALKDKRVKKRLKKVETLVIDEISMISGITLQAAETISRLARESTEAWGGIKVIAVGDFGQLPPVSQGSATKDWAFQSEAWKKSHFKIAYLKTVMRSTDEDFLNVLNFIRNGQINEIVTQFLNSKMKAPDSNFSGTRLFSHRQSVEDYNLTELKNLEGEVFRFPTVYNGNEKFLQAIQKSAPIPEVLHLKVGALVMLRKNDPMLNYVNGSLGIIKSIKEAELKIKLLKGTTVTIEPEAFSYMNAEGEIVASAQNFPVNLAWATTIHKSQGVTLDAATMDLSKVFEAGQAYVALSRVKSADALYLSSWNPNAIRASAEVRAFHEEILKETK